MTSANKKLAILNLTGELAPELSEYFFSRDIKVINPLECDDVYQWTHIITKDIHDFALINKTYQVLKNKIQLISLTKIEDLQNFVLNNGNLVLDEIWFSSGMGEFMMDKYFQDYAVVNNGDNYPTFKEIGSFNITNPFNTGEYLDKLVQKAFEVEVDALSIKTYFDHFIMYVCALKSKSKAALPIEVTYGVFEEIFGVQINFFSNKLDILDVALGLKSKICKKPEEYYLNISVQAADFFDFSYIPEVKKVTVTALWSKDERVKFENRGLMFSPLGGHPALMQLQNQGTTSVITDSSKVPDHSDKVSVPDLSTQSEIKQIIKGTIEQADTPVSIVPEKHESTDSFKYDVKEIPERKDEVRLLKGDGVLKDLVQTVKEKLDNESSSMIIKSGKLDIDETITRISSHIDESAKEKNLMVRSMENDLPKSIKTGLFDYAKGLNKSIEQLDKKELAHFEENKLGEIIRGEIISKMIKDDEWDKNQLLNHIKSLENQLKEEKILQDKARFESKQYLMEIKAIKEAHKKVTEAQNIQIDILTKVSSQTHDDLRNDLVQSLSGNQKIPSEEKLRISTFLNNEKNFIEELKEAELKYRKLHIESEQRQRYLSNEIEKCQRQNRAKDLMLIKTKESFSRALDHKDKQLTQIRAQFDEYKRLNASNPVSGYILKIQDLEKENFQLLRQIDLFKDRVSTMNEGMTNNSEDRLKEQIVKIKQAHQQSMNKLLVLEKENLRLRTNSEKDSNLVAKLKDDNLKLNIELKERSKTSTTTVDSKELELKKREIGKLHAANNKLNEQLNEASLKIRSLEAKIEEHQKSTKSTPTAPAEEGSKVKLNQMEASVKKLSNDVNDLRNQLGEAKKESNKLRLEKTALQNQLDKAMKENAKRDPASKNKLGGKAA